MRHCAEEGALQEQALLWCIVMTEQKSSQSASHRVPGGFSACGVTELLGFRVTG
jgi:hypothetical protein